MGTTPADHTVTTVSTTGAVTTFDTTLVSSTNTRMSSEVDSLEKGLDNPMDTSKLQKATQRTLRASTASQLKPPSNLKEKGEKEAQKAFIKELKAFCALQGHDKPKLLEQMEKPEFKESNFFKQNVPILDIHDVINRNQAKYEIKMSWHAVYARVENLQDE